MTDHSIIKALICFLGDIETLSISPFGNGHINTTYISKTTNGDFILQKINKDLFNIIQLEKNYQLLSNPTINLTDIVPFYHKKYGNIHLKDNNNNYWRCSTYLKDSKTYSISPSTDVTEAAGHIISRFLTIINILQPDSFGDTISNFHDSKKRYHDYIDVLKKSEAHLKNTSITEIEFIDKHKYIIEEVTDLLNTKSIPIRITHNDPKLENILFFNDRSPVVTDLDTVMKGYIMFDFGDMVRSISSLSKEDEKDLSKVSFNKAHFEAMCKGFFSKIKFILMKNEAENMYTGIISIIYVQAMRFLSDYLRGNTYYPVSYKEHNLIRCKTQIKLLDDILKNEDWVRLTIERSAKI